MSIRVLALALLAGVALAEAAPPTSHRPKADPTDTQQPAESLDIDAMARAKDSDAATPADTDAPPPAESPPSDAPPAATPAPEAAPAQMPSETPAAQAQPAATEAPPAASDAPAPPEPMPSTAETGTPPVDAGKPSAESAERSSIAASCVARATSLLDDAQKGDFAGATRDFDAKMRTALPAPKLKEAWDSLAQFGPLTARGQSHLGTAEGYLLVMIPLIFEKTNLVAQVACGSDGRIAGFHITPAPKPRP